MVKNKIEVVEGIKLSGRIIFDKPMEKLKINLNFEELDKLPPEQYNELERRYLEYLTKLITSVEEDYCRKKGVKREAILQNYEFYFKMRNAVNQRKIIKEATRTCMMFNKLLRNVLQLNSEGKFI